MRLVVEVSDEKLQRFKECAANEGRTQADVIRAAVDEYIKKAEKREHAGAKQE